MRKKQLYLFCIIIISMVSFSISCTRKIPNSSQYFKKYILDPIPVSVTDIKADQSSYFGGYVFGFKINEDDLNLIINSKSLKKVPYLGYANGRLSIKIEQSTIYDELVYQPEYGIKEPTWFYPQKWSKADAYALLQDRFNQILLYNKDTGEAYFCTRRWW